MTVGIKKFWTEPLSEDSKNNSLFKVYKENCEYTKVPLLNDDILKNKSTIIIKEMIKNMQICSSFSHKPVLLLTNDRKTRLKPALSENYQSVCDQDFSQSIYL